MDMQGSRALAVTQQQAWDALNNPEVLKVCFPSCDKVEATGENQYAIGVAVKVGPVAAKFGGKIAQLGQRLIDGVAKSMAEDFFKRFDAEMQRQHPQAYADAAAAAAESGAAAPAPATQGGDGTVLGVPVWIWIAGAAVVGVLVAIFS